MSLMNISYKGWAKYGLVFILGIWFFILLLISNKLYYQNGSFCIYVVIANLCIIISHILI